MKIFIIILLIIMVVAIAPIPFTTWHMSEDFVDDPIFKFPHKNWTSLLYNDIC